MRVIQTFQQRQLSAEECLRLFRTRKRAAYVGLRHARSKVSGGLRHAYATLSLLSCRVVNVSSRSCHCVLWAALQSQGKVARWRKILEKNSKGDVKNMYWQRKIRPIILNKSGRKRARQIGRETVAAGHMGVGGAFASLFRHAYVIAYACLRP